MDDDVVEHDYTLTQPHFYVKGAVLEEDIPVVKPKVPLHAESAKSSSVKGKLFINTTSRKEIILNFLFWNSGIHQKKKEQQEITDKEEKKVSFFSSKY